MINLDILKQNFSENKEPILFVSKFLSIYFGLTLFYEFYIEPKTTIDESLIYLIIEQSEYILRTFNYELLKSNTLYPFHFGIKDTLGVIIGPPCNGIALFTLYLTFILVFKGKLLYKLAFGIAGIGIIHLMNLARVIALAFVVLYYPDMLDFHHKYTFTLFVYVVVFFMWFLRIRIYKKYKR